MSYSFDTDGWELFSTPFSTPVRTAPTPQPSKQATDIQNLSAVQQSNPAPVITAPAPAEKPAPTVQTQANTTKPEPASPPTRNLRQNARQNGKRNRQQRNRQRKLPCKSLTL